MSRNRLTVVPLDVYLRNAERRVSNSLLDAFLEDRRDAQAKLTGTGEDSQTPDMLLGSYAHALVLEPLEVSKRYAMPPLRGDAGLPCDARKIIDRRFTEGKEAWAKFEAELGTRQVISPDQDDIARAIVEALQQHDEASRLLWSGGGEAERVLEWDDPDTGIPMQARPDRRFAAGAYEDEAVLVELKTDRDIHPYKKLNVWRWYDRGYHRKAAFYIDGYHAVFGHSPRFAFIFVENNLKPRVCVRWLECDSPAVETGRIEYRNALDAFLRCRESGDWREAWEKQSTAFEVPAQVLRQHDLLEDEITIGGARVFG